MIDDVVMKICVLFHLNTSHILRLSPPLVAKSEVLFRTKGAEWRRLSARIFRICRLQGFLLPPVIFASNTLLRWCYLMIIFGEIKLEESDTGVLVESSLVFILGLLTHQHGSAPQTITSAAPRVWWAGARLFEQPGPLPVHEEPANIDLESK